MSHHPDLVSGTRRADLAITQSGRGDWISKAGADGMQTIGVRSQGLGIAIRIADGNTRAVHAATVEVLEQLDSARRSERHTAGRLRLSADSQLSRHRDRRRGAGIKADRTLNSAASHDFAGRRANRRRQHLRARRKIHRPHDLQLAKHSHDAAGAKHGSGMRQLQPHQLATAVLEHVARMRGLRRPQSASIESRSAECLPTPTRRFPARRSSSAKSPRLIDRISPRSGTRAHASGQRFAAHRPRDQPRPRWQAALASRARRVRTSAGRAGATPLRVDCDDFEVRPRTKLQQRVVRSHRNVLPPGEGRAPSCCSTQSMPSSRVLAPDDDVVEFAAPHRTPINRSAFRFRGTDTKGRSRRCTRCA